jgi:hypothetical protein
VKAPRSPWWGGEGGELALSIDVSLVLILNLYFHKFYYSLSFENKRHMGKGSLKKREKKGYKMT